MKHLSHHSDYSQPVILPLCAILLLVFMAGSASADDDSSGLVQWLTGIRPENARLLRAARLSFSGWLNAGITYNPSSPGDGYNGPVTFSDRSGVLQMGQFYVSLERPVDMHGEHWDLGGHVDVLFGSDALFTQANGDAKGHWDQNLLHTGDYSLALPQLYLETFIPLGKGIDLKAGHFYTRIGSESVMAPDNFFASHSYMMQYGEPFTHTGFMASYPLTDLIRLNLGAATGSSVAGWDGGFDRYLDNWAFLGGLDYANESGDTTVALNAVQGETRGTAPGSLNVYSLVLHHDFSETWHYTLQQDYGWSGQDTAGNNAEWYGIAHYLSYDIDRGLSAGLRAEWFRDDDGVRVQSAYRATLFGDNADIPLSATGSGYYALTAGLRWKPASWITVRPSIRYDWADQKKQFDCQGGRCSQSNQLLFSTDVILSL